MKILQTTFDSLEQGVVHFKSKLLEIGKYFSFWTLKYNAVHKFLSLFLSCYIQQRIKGLSVQC